MDRGKGKGTSVHTAVYVPKHYMQGNMECIDAMVAVFGTGPPYKCAILSFNVSIGICTIHMMKWMKARRAKLRADLTR